MGLPKMGSNDDISHSLSGVRWGRGYPMSQWIDRITENFNKIIRDMSLA
jgi:hypothetical protein